MPQLDVSNCQWVDGNYEKKVPTRTDLYTFLNWYVETIRECKEHEKELRVINATEGGAKIEGTEVMTLKDAIAETCTKEINVTECLDTLTPMLDEKNSVWAHDYLLSIPKEFEKLKDEARKLNKSYTAVDRLCEKNQMDSKQYLKTLRKIKKQIANIEKNDMYQLVTMTMPAAAKIMRDEEFERLDSLQEEGKEIARKGKLYTELVGEAADLLRCESEHIFAELNENSN